MEISTGNNVMLDIETLGKAVIVSIGAVLFNEFRIRRSFHVHIDLQNALNKGLDMDASTVLWWLAQSEVARSALLDGQKTSRSLSKALRDFALFLPCGNVASFDNAILAVGLEPPWKFWNDRCCYLKGINNYAK